MNNPTTHKHLRGAIVLLVEDEPYNLDIITLALKWQGAHVTATQSVPDAYKHLAENNRFNLILSDLSMPEIDGWAFHSHLRQQAPTKDLPVIAITAHALAGDRDKVFEAGFDGYIQKPIEVATIGTSIKTIVPLIGKHILTLLTPTTALLSQVMRHKGASLTVSAGPDALADEILKFTPDILLRSSKLPDNAVQYWATLPKPKREKRLDIVAYPSAEPITGHPDLQLFGNESPNEIAQSIITYLRTDAPVTPQNP
jgi:CheY-like chemotaxis protein